MADTDTKVKVEQAIDAGQKFVELFYEALDKRRHVIGKFYMDTATLVWNGHSLSSPDNIVKFLENLPTSEHTVEAYDAQPMANDVTKGQTTIVVSVSGVVQYKKQRLRTFTQNFILTAQNTSWKIVSDCIRTAE